MANMHQLFALQLGCPLSNVLGYMCPRPSNNNNNNNFLFDVAIPRDSRLKRRIHDVLLDNNNNNNNNNNNEASLFETFITI